MASCFRFGTFVVDPHRRQLIGAGGPLPLTPKALDLLLFLLRNRDRIVTRDELFAGLWADAIVEDNNLSQQIHRLRRLLGSGAGGVSPIATVPGRGFQFVGNVEEVDAPPAMTPGSPSRLNPAPKPWPMPGDTLIGREQDVTRVAELLRTSFLVTLTGPGGVGKTRLAVAAGENVRGDQPTEGYWVDLTEAEQPSDVIPLAARALGLADTGKRLLVTRMRDWLAGRRVLIVFDNFEHVVTAAPCLLDLRSPDNQVTCLVTSRVRLGIRGEREYSVAPLAWQAEDPEDPRHVAPAVRLFLDRLAVEQEDRPSVRFEDIARLCARLDGLPLAIELAAARARYVPAAEMAKRDRLVAFLPHAGRDVPERQKTLAHTLRWSYGLLPSDRQRALRLLTAFSGGFTAESAASVLLATGAATDDAGACDVVAGLHESSLVAFAGEAAGFPRFRLLDTVREFADDLLDPSERAAARSAHADWVASVFEQCGPALRSSGDIPVMDRLLAEQGNLMTSLRWAADVPEPALLGRLVSAAVPFWHTSNLFTDGQAWTTRALEVLNPVRFRTTPERELGAGHALLAYHNGALDVTSATIARLLAECDDDRPALLARCLETAVLAFAGDPGQAERTGADACAAAAGDRWLTGFACLTHSYAASLAGDHDLAYRRLDAAPAGLGFLDTLIDINRSLQALLIGRAEDAKRGFTRWLDQRYGTYTPIRQIAGSLEGLAYVSNREGDHRRAALLLGSADRWRGETAPLLPPWFLEHERAVTSVRSALREQFRDLWTQGAALTLDQVRAAARGTSPL